MENNEFNNFGMAPGQPMVEPPKKKSKAPLIIFLILLIFGAGICAGIFVPKLLKGNSKDNTTAKDTEKEEKPKDEEVEETEEEKKEYVKPERNSNYKFVKEDEQIIKLNDKEYHLLAYYYDDDDKDIQKAEAFGLIKEVYFEGELIIKKSSLLYSEKKDKDKTINEDIKYAKEMTTVLNDKVSSEQYLVYFFEDDFLNMMWANEDDDTGYPDDGYKAMVVTKEGKILFNETIWSAGSVCYLWINNKEEVLDRNTVQGNSDNSAYFDEELEGEYNGSDYYSLYVENVNGYTYPIEFKKDHFYYFAGPFTNEGNKDYLYTIENGSLKKKLLKEYSGSDEDDSFLIDGAGQGCD